MLATLSTGAEVVYDDASRGKLSEADRQIDVSVRSCVERPSIALSSSRVNGSKGRRDFLRITAFSF
jgi:hypothetical protein